MGLNVGDIVTLLPEHTKYYDDHAKVRSWYEYIDGTVSKEYYTIIKILDSLKNKTIRAKVMQVGTSSALVYWINTIGEYSEYVSFENMKKVSVINKPMGVE